MKKKMLVLMAVLVIASLGFASVVSAESEDGMGTLEARGDGFVGLHGTGYIRVRGTGVLWVKGEEFIRIQGDGHKKVFPSGWTELRRLQRDRPHPWTEGLGAYGRGEH